MEGSTQKPNWFRRHPVWSTVLGIVAVLVVIGALSGGGDDTSSSAEASSDDSSESSSSFVSGRIGGSFDRDAFLAEEDMVAHIDTSDVWCGWRDGKVIVAVTMTNNSVEHVTVNWHPSYRIRGGSAHGEGIGAQQSDGFDSGETRYLEAEQEPEGTPEGAAISKCFPSFSTIEAG